MQAYLEDVVQDYEKSFVGGFMTNLFDILKSSKSSVYMAVVKFSGLQGFSLTKNPSTESQHNSGLDTIQEEAPARKEALLNQGALPEFVPVTDLYDFYKRMLDVNL